MNNEPKEPIKRYQDLKVYQKAFDAAMQIFEVSKRFPLEEKDALIEPIRRSSRCVCTNLAQAWHKRRFKSGFVAKLNDSQVQAAETQAWIEFAVKCNYLNVETGRELYRTYNSILEMLVNLIQNSDVSVER